MWTAVKLVWSDKTIRIATLTSIFVGFTYASTIPYYTLIGINQLGISPAHYAVVSALAALMAMVGSVAMGFLADRSPNRKTGVIFSLSVGLLGFTSFYMLPSVYTFVALLLFVTPLSGASYSQLFAIIRVVSNTRAPQEAAQINAAARAAYAVSWVVVPGLVGAYIATRNDVSASFAIAALAFFACLIMYGIWGAPGGRVEANSQSALQGLKEAFGLIASKHIAWRIAALAMIASVQPANMLLLPLMITEMPSGTTKDIGIIAGLTAGLEVPLMLLGGYVASRVALWKIIVAGGLVYATYIGLLGLTTTVPTLYLLAVLNALGNAIMLTLHLTYYQNLLPDRPGLGTSLLSIGGLACKTISAGVFALAGTALGFPGASFVACAVALAGCGLLVALDRRQVTPPS
jgi:MFS family permease